MKIFCNKEKLSDALSKVSHAISVQSALKEIKGVLLQAEKDTLTLTGFDLSLGIVCTIAADVAEEGSIIIPQTLVEIVRRSTAETIEIRSDEKNVIEIFCGNADYKLFGFEGSQYPELPHFEMSKSFDIPAIVLLRLIKQSIFCISSVEGKPVLQGTLFDIEDGNIAMVSQDGFRMALARDKINYAETAKFIVPGKSLGEIAKIIKDTGIVNVFVGKTHCCFKTSESTIYSRLITQGEFVNYKPIIPKEHTTLVKVKTREFLECIERVVILADSQENKKIKNSVLAEYKKDGLTLNRVTIQGKAQDKVSCHLEGNEIEIGVNSSFIVDALRAAETDEIALRMNSARSAIKITPSESEDFVFLVMPVKPGNE